MRRQIEPVFALSQKNYEIRLLSSASAPYVYSLTVSFLFHSVFTAKVLSLTYPFSPFSFSFCSQFSPLCSLYVTESPRHCLPCVFLCRSKPSIWSLILRDARYHTDRSSPFPSWRCGWDRKRSNPWTRETERNRLFKRYLRLADKFIPSRERRDIGMHLYRRLGKIRCQIGAAREKLPMDVSFKDPPPAYLAHPALFLSQVLPLFHGDTDATFADSLCGVWHINALW